MLKYIRLRVNQPILSMLAQQQSFIYPKDLLTTKPIINFTLMVVGFATPLKDEHVVFF